jgi:hypothetical protein
MGRKRRQWNTPPQKFNYNIIEDLIYSEGDESSVADIRRMIMRMSNEFKEKIWENMQKQLNKNQENMD